MDNEGILRWKIERGGKRREEMVAYEAGIGNTGWQKGTRRKRKGDHGGKRLIHYRH